MVYHFIFDCDVEIMLITEGKRGDNMLKVYNFIKSTLKLLMFVLIYKCLS
jgi:hypothetical protein